MADTKFSFGIRYGNLKKILLVMAGGGMCFNGDTCIGSPLAGPGLSTYDQTSNDLDGRIKNPTGILDTQNSNNPYKDYTIILGNDCTYVYRTLKVCTFCNFTFSVSFHFFSRYFFALTKKVVQLYSSNR